MSARFVAYLEQEAEGCDYSIACGVQLISVIGSTYDEAVADLRQIVLESFNNREYRLKHIALYEVSKVVEQPVSEWYTEYEADQKRIVLEQELVAEREQYERLRRKYG